MVIKNKSLKLLFKGVHRVGDYPQTRVIQVFVMI